MPNPQESYNQAISDLADLMESSVRPWTLPQCKECCERATQASRQLVIEKLRERGYL